MNTLKLHSRYNFINVLFLYIYINTHTCVQLNLVQSILRFHTHNYTCIENLYLSFLFKSAFILCTHIHICTYIHHFQLSPRQLLSDAHSHPNNNSHIFTTSFFPLFLLLHPLSNSALSFFLSNSSRRKSYRSSEW